MRHGMYGGITTLALLAALAAPPATQAQPGPLGEAYGSAGPSDLGIPGEPSEKIPIPTGNPGGHGFYGSFEFVYLAQDWTIGDQVIAKRGLVDSTGRLTGVPGTYLGSGVDGLRTQDLGRTGFQPGYQITLGYKTDDNVSVYASHLQTMRSMNSVAATSATPFARSRPDLADTFLTSAVYNFPSQYSGPLISTPIEQQRGGNLFYGLWNGAIDQVISVERNFTQSEIGARVPLYQTEYSRIYAMAGGRFNWFFERFRWDTLKSDINSFSNPFDRAMYKNTLSQRMYGPFVGCGHEVYMGSRFSASLDLTAAGLVNIVKERAKYELGTHEIQNKRSRNDYTLTPSFTGNLNLWWYPIEGVQVRAGYNAWTFFNTRSMDQPVGFNYGNPDPVYEFEAFRIVHGLNFGVGLFF